MSVDDLKQFEEKIKKEAVEELKLYPNYRMQSSENQSECLKKLNDLMNMKYNDFKETIKKQNRDFMLKKVLPTIALGIGGATLLALSVTKPK